MEHIMKLYEDSFNRVKEGKKKREYRLNDDKRKQVRVGDTIKFLKLPNLDEELVVDVKKIETFSNWDECYSKYFDEDFKDRYKSVDEIVNDTYKGYYTKEESDKIGCVVFTIKKHRVTHENATVCYLKKDNKILMIKFNNKWGNVYAPPGGKFEPGESPLDCIKREFFEETGLTLLNPHLQGISYWKGKTEGIIFVYIAESYKGKLKTSSEGALEWISEDKLLDIKQFDQNRLFTKYLFKPELFEGKFVIDDNCTVKKYEIRSI